jgi:hypothetical protein
VRSGAARLSCGSIDYGAWRNPLFLRLPPITGLRAVPRGVFEAVPEGRRNGFQIEILLHEVTARRGLPCSIRIPRGLRHRTKIDKLGWRRGVVSHGAMTAELLACLRIVPLWTYRSYLRHLVMANEILACTLLTLHNLHFYLDLVAQARAHIEAGDYASWHRAWVERFEAGEAASRGR